MISNRHFIPAAMFFVVLLSAQSVWAGPPFITDDPEPVEYKHWEVYLFSIYTHTQGADGGQFPAIEVNYGIIPDVHLHLIAPVAYDREPGEHPHYGYGDTELGVKWRFFNETDVLPEIGTFPLLEIKTGDANRGLGSGHNQVFLPIWLQKSWGEENQKWTTYGGGGFWYNPGDQHRNFFRVGWLLQRDLGEHLTLGGEIFHETPSQRGEPFMPGIGGETIPGSRGHTAFNLGGQWNFDEHQHLLFSAGRDIDGPNRFMCYLGYQLTF